MTTVADDHKLSIIVPVYNEEKNIPRLIERLNDTLRQLLNDSAREVDRRWSQNIMLGKWLDYLHDMGHQFLSPAPVVA